MGFQEAGPQACDVPEPLSIVHLRYAKGSCWVQICSHPDDAGVVTVKNLSTGKMQEICLSTYKVTRLDGNVAMYVDNSKRSLKECIAAGGPDLNLKSVLKEAGLDPGLRTFTKLEMEKIHINPNGVPAGEFDALKMEMPVWGVADKIVDEPVAMTA